MDDDVLEIRKSFLYSLGCSYQGQEINTRLVLMVTGMIDSLMGEAGGHHRIFEKWFGHPSIHDLTPAQKYALVTWANPAVVGGRWAYSREFLEEFGGNLNG